MIDCIKRANSYIDGVCIRIDHWIELWILVPLGGWLFRVLGVDKSIKAGFKRGFLEGYKRGFGDCKRQVEEIVGDEQA